MLVLTNLEVYQMIQVKRLRTEVVLIVGGALAILFPSGLAFSQAFTPADAIAQGYSQAPHNLLIHPVLRPLGTAWSSYLGRPDGHARRRRFPGALRRMPLSGGLGRPNLRGSGFWERRWRDARRYRVLSW